MTNPAYIKKRKQSIPRKTKKKVMIGDFKIISFDLHEIVNNSYKMKL